MNRTELSPILDNHQASLDDPSTGQAANLSGAVLTGASIPPLERHCGSWIVVSRATGEPVLETFSRRTAEAINQDAYEVLTALQWLVRYNAACRLQ